MDTADLIKGDSEHSSERENIVPREPKVLARRRVSAQVSIAVDITSNAWIPIRRFTMAMTKRESVQSADLQP